VGSIFTGWTCCTHGLGDILVSPVLWLCRLGWRTSEGGVLTFRLMRQPLMLVRRLVCEQFSLCNLVCGWLSGAASLLECKWWYVGMVVPESDVGGALGDWISGWWPWNIVSVDNL
jgi:hypothetical protein